MAEAKAGDVVQVHYTGRLDDGTVFDSSQGHPPLEFTIGEGQVIAGFDDAVEGMAPGESKTVRIPADQAYGEHNQGLVLWVDPGEFPPDIRPEVGQQLQVQQEGGVPVVVTVAEVSEKGVALDANHPLAGQALTFDLQLVGIR